VQRHDDIRFESDQLIRQLTEPFYSSLRIPVLDGDVPALDIPQIAQALFQRRHEVRWPEGRLKNTDPIDLI